MKEKMITKKIVGFVLALAMILSFVGTSVLEIRAEGEEYNESEVLDGIAEDWISTCNKIIELNNIALEQEIFAKIDVASTTNGNYCYRIKTDDALNELENDPNCSEETKALIQNYREQRAEESINLLKDILSEGTTIVEYWVKRYAEFKTVEENCNLAIDKFNEALSTDDIDSKRQLMIEAVSFGSIGCSLFIDDADSMVKNTSCTKEEVFDYLMDEAKSEIQGVIEEELEIDGAGDVIEYAIKVAPSAQQITKLQKFVNKQTFSDKEKNEFWTALANPYGVYGVSFKNFSVVMNKYNGYLLTETPYKTVNIPDNCYSLPVKYISSGFMDGKDDSHEMSPNDVIQVTIPSSIEHLGQSIVNCNNLQQINYNAVNACNDNYTYRVIKDCNTNFKVVIGDGVQRIPTGFIQNCDIEEIEIPESVTQIGQEWVLPSFIKCSKLKKVNVPSGVVKIDGLLDDCDSIETINYNAKNSVIQNGLGRIIKNCDSDFQVIFGEGITKIPHGFIDNCGISSLTIPEGVTRIGGDFNDAACCANCPNLKELTVPSTVEKTGQIIDNCDNLEKVNYNAKKSESLNGFDRLIKNCDSEFQVVFGEGIEKIPFGFIQSCGISSLTIPEGVTRIGGDFNYAACCVSCPNLKEVTVPSTVEKTGQIINNCDNLEKVNYNAKSAGTLNGLDRIIRNCDSDFILNVSDGVESIPGNFIDNCGITQIVLPESVKRIGGNAFNNEKLQTITVPNKTCEVVSQYSIHSNAVIRGYMNTPIHRYAKKLNRNFEAIGCNHEFETSIMPSTCATQGEKVSACKVCGYVNNKEILEIDNTNHDYSNPVFTWSGDGKSCSVTFTCKNDASHTVTYDCNVTSDVIDDASCEKNGTTRYTATYENYSDTKDLQDIPAFGKHDYDNPVFTWSGDGKSCSVTLTCKNDKSHTITHDCTVTSKVKTKATCSSKGITTYTATYMDENGKTYTDTKDVKDIPINKTAHTIKTTVTPATTKADGKIKQTCTSCKNYTKTTKINKIGAMKLSATSATYNGKAIQPTVTVTDSKGKTINPKYYTVKYAKNTNVGTAAVKVTFKDRYKGSLTKTFTIVPKKTAIKAVSIPKNKNGTYKKGYMTANWTALTGAHQKQITGYQLQVSADPNFKSVAKTVTAGKPTATAKTISGLKKGKYYIRIRTYAKAQNGTTYYSGWVKWSKTATVK